MLSLISSYNNMLGKVVDITMRSGKVLRGRLDYVLDDAIYVSVEKHGENVILEKKCWEFTKLLPANN